MLVKVSVFGLGYVGIVAAACLRARGHEVVGVDVVESKVAAVNAGRSPVNEPGVNDLLTVESSTPRVRTTGDHADAVRETNVSVICVGTPPLPSGTWSWHTWSECSGRYSPPPASIRANTA